MKAVECLYNKQNNSRALGDMEDYSVTPYLRAPIYYSLSITFT